MTEKKPDVRIAKLSEFRQLANNPNAGSVRGQYMIETSFEKFGAWRSIAATSDGMIPAGNHASEIYGAQHEDDPDVIVVKTDGKQLVIVQREDISSDDPRAMEYAVADNRASEVGLEWDADIMQLLKATDGIHLDDYWFEDEFKALFSQDIIEPEKEFIAIAELKPHPLAFREYPKEIIEHLIEKIRASGQYRNIEVARDNTILSGAGYIQAASLIEVESLSIVRHDLDPMDTAALKILINDNEMEPFIIRDDRRLTEILKDIKERDPNGLIGTGFDEQMLANLLYVTRPRSEIEEFNEAEHWVGMPEYGETFVPYKLVISFRNMEDREEALRRLDNPPINKAQGKTITVWYPPKDDDDAASLYFDQ